jgi:hypothetical protein
MFFYFSLLAFATSGIGEARRALIYSRQYIPQPLPLPSFRALRSHQSYPQIAIVFREGARRRRGKKAKYNSSHCINPITLPEI